MGLFGFNDRSSVNDDMAIAPNAGDGKLYRLVQLIAISVFLVAVTLLILEIFQVLIIGTTANGIIFSIGVVGAGGLVALPWVRVFEAFKEKPYKITAIVFLSVVGVCVVLWIVSVWLIIGLVNKGMEGAVGEALKELVRSLNVIRVSLIVSLQFIVASYIAKNIIKYNKTLLPYQVMAGVSQLYIDFYFILVLTAITITTKGIEFNQSAFLLTNRWTHALLAVFFVLSIFPSVVFRRTDRRNMLRARHDGAYETFGEKGQPQPQQPAAPIDVFGDAGTNVGSGTSVDEKLNKIKELLDKGLITQEEYDKKREDIINNI